MATYLPSSAAVPQSVDGLQTLYLMKPNYGLTESSNNASSNNMLFISPNGVLAQANNTFSGQPVVQNHQQAAYYNTPNSSLFPSTGTLLSNNQTNLSSSSRNYQSWAGGGNEVSFMQQSLNDENAFMANINPHTPYSSIRTQPGLASIEHIHHQMESNSLQRGGEREGLSLSLSPGQNQLAPQLVSQPTANSLSFLQDIDGKSNREALAGMGSFLTTSKYLKATQQLLEEVVSVNSKAAKPPKSTGSSITQNKPGFSSFNNNNNSNNNMSCVKDPLTFSVDMSERQELQMKKAKLMAMLDEVDRRYRQYYFQMQMVVSSLDSAAGIGSAKTYTSLALKTISRHFRCLRDAICGQIRVACDSLGETEDVLEATGKSEPSRMHQYLNPPPPRPSLQHLGILQQQQQQHVWRPQRGLPERSVSILRAWLFEHFLHPYPKDGDKIMLARQTGLSRSQVSNWFINARVRLWKPMVEEMYTEEMKDVDHANNNNNSNNNNNHNHNHNHDHDGTGGKLPQPTSNRQKDQTTVKEEGKTGNIPALNSNQNNNNLGKRLLSRVKNGGDDYDGQCDNDGNDDGGNEDGDDDGDDDDEDVVDDDGVHEEEQQDYHAGMKRSRSNNGMGMGMGMGMGVGVGMGMGMDEDGNYISNGGASYVDAYPSYHHHHHHQAGQFNPVTLTLGLHQNNNHYNSNNSNCNINNNNNNNEMNIGLSLAGAPVQQEQQQSPFHRLLHVGGAPAEDFFHVAHNADSARHVIPNFDALDFHGRRIVSTHHDFVA